MRLGELDLNALPLQERAEHVAFVPQALPQNAELTVLRGVVATLMASPPAKTHSSHGKVRDRTADVLERLGIIDLVMESMGRLSGGLRQLASLAQAVARAPKLLLLDEPARALDPRHQLDVMTIVRELAREGPIVMVVMHDLTLAATWARPHIALDRGTVAADGAPEAALTPLYSGASTEKTPTSRSVRVAC